MQIKEIIEKIEDFAPLDSQEEWDNCGWQILPNDFNKEVNRILVTLSITENTIKQAVIENCDLIISHHPFLFPHAVPIEFNKNIPIYSAHTNLDKADGGTTDTLIEKLGYSNAQKIGDFLRIVELDKPQDFGKFIIAFKIKLNTTLVRVVNNTGIKAIKKIAFCAGSGIEFLNEAKELGADVFVTGDVKYHSAIDSDVIIIDAGHFETERPVLERFKKLLAPTEVIIANEKNPFIYY